MPETENNTDNTQPSAGNERQSERTQQPPGPDSSGDAGNDKFMEFTRKMTSSAEKAIGASYKKVKAAVRKGDFNPRRSVAWLDDMLDSARTLFTPGLYESIARWFARYGHAGLVAAQALAFLFYTAASIKTGDWTFMLVGIGMTLLLIVLQYTADKFLNAGESLLKTSPSKLGSAAFLNCLALLAEVTGLALLIYCIVSAPHAGAWSAVLVGLGFWGLCDAMAYIALNPSMANISIDENLTAGEEAIGIMSFLVKAVVRIVPLAFGIGSIIGSIALLLALVPLLRTGMPTAGNRALSLVTLCACLPLASYVVFAFYHLIVDLMRSVLAPRNGARAMEGGQ